MNPLIEIVDGEIAEAEEAVRQAEEKVEKLRAAREALVDVLGEPAPRKARKPHAAKKAKPHTPSGPRARKSSGGDRSRGRKARGGKGETTTSTGGTCGRTEAGGCRGDVQAAACDACNYTVARCAHHSRGPGHPAKALARHRRDAHG